MKRENTKVGNSKSFGFLTNESFITAELREHGVFSEDKYNDCTLSPLQSYAPESLPDPGPLLSAPSLSLSQSFMDAPIMKSSRKIVHPGPSSDFTSVWGQLQKQKIKRQFNHKKIKKPKLQNELIDT